MCSYLSCDIRPNQREHTLLRVPILIPRTSHRKNKICDLPQEQHIQSTFGWWRIDLLCYSVGRLQMTLTTFILHFSGLPQFTRGAKTLRSVYPFFSSILFCLKLVWSACSSCSNFKRTSQLRNTLVKEKELKNNVTMTLGLV